MAHFFIHPVGLEPFRKFGVGGWWSKGILKYRFGPNLGRRLEARTKLNNCYDAKLTKFQLRNLILLLCSLCFLSDGRMVGVEIETSSVYFSVVVEVEIEVYAELRNNIEHAKFSINPHN